MINKELLEYFQGLFENKLPLKRGTTAEELAFLQGQQSVIQRMLLLYEGDNPKET